MNLLFLTYDIPYPTNSGGKTRAYNLLRMRDKSINVTLFSFTREEIKEKSREGLIEIGIEKLHLFKRQKLKSIGTLSTLFDKKNSIFHKLYYKKEVEEELLKIIKEEKIDVVHFESFYTGFYISEKIKKLGIKQVFGTENIEANIYDDYIKYSVSPLFKPFYNNESKKIRREEESMMEIADISLAVTPSEKEYIENISKKDCCVVENGVDLKKFTFEKRKKNDKKILLFVGNFSYFPNADAIDFFYHGVFKKIENKKITLVIIGKGSTKLEFINDPNVRAEEYVSDIIEEYNKADIFVSPIRIGGGTNFKILESMATGLPVIALPHRLHDLEVKDKEHLLIAQNENEYIASISELLNNKALVEKITRNARKLIEEKYSYEKIGRTMNNIWLKV